MEGKEITGYPSIDKPWLKYYPNFEKIEIPQKSMFRLIYDQNKAYASSVAINYFDNKITYGQFFESVKNVAGALWKYGVRKGDAVTIVSFNTPETLYCIYALNYIGAVANMGLPTITQSELTRIIQETNSKMVFILDQVAENVSCIECDCPVVILPLSKSAGVLSKIILGAFPKRLSVRITWKEFINSSSDSNAVENTSDSVPAIIVYTSGTTGIPKGVVLSSRNLNSVVILNNNNPMFYKEGERFLNILPPFLSFGIGIIHLCLFIRMEMIPVLLPSSKAVMKKMKKYKPQRMAIGPAITDVIDKYNGKDLSFLLGLIGGGGSISIDKERELNHILDSKSAKTKYLNGYGMSELSSGVASNYNTLYKENSVGTILPLCNLKIVDVDTGEELKYNQKGELLISSPGLMMGYYKNPEATGGIIEEMNGERWLHTGDLATVDEQGFITIVGRIKRIFAVRDEKGVWKLFPQRMEEIIEKDSAVEKCAVVVIGDSEKGYVPVVFISVQPLTDRDVLKKRLVMMIEKELPSFYRPKDIVFVDTMPLTASQKIDYQQLERFILNEDK